MSMEEFPERELRRMQREQERERRRIRDRQRRQSMTQEQRERHLARRRRNYQLRRLRAANVHAPYTPFHQFQTLESSAGEASTGDEFQGLTSSTFLDYSDLSQGIGFPHHGLNQGLETLNFGTKVVEGEFLLYMFTIHNYSTVCSFYLFIFSSYDVVQPIRTIISSLGNFSL